MSSHHSANIVTIPDPPGRYYTPPHYLANIVTIPDPPRSHYTPSHHSVNRASIPTPAGSYYTPSHHSANIVSIPDPSGSYYAPSHHSVNRASVPNPSGSYYTPSHHSANIVSIPDPSGSYYTPSRPSEPEYTSGHSTASYTQHDIPTATYALRPARNSGPSTNAESPVVTLPTGPTTLPIKVITGGLFGRPLEEPDILEVLYDMLRLALDILGSEASVKALVYIGTNAVWHWCNGKHNVQSIIYPTKPCKDQKYVYEKPSDSEMKGWVDFFLQKLRHSFPAIRIDNSNDDMPPESQIAGNKHYGSFRRCDWMERAKNKCAVQRQQPSNENIMLHWEPMDAGTMTLDLEVSPVLFFLPTHMCVCINPLPSFLR